MLAEERSRTTYQNLAGAKRALERRNPGGGRHRIVVVSDPFHMFRAVKQAADLGMDAYPSPTRTSPLSASRLKLTELVLREDLAIAGYLLSGALGGVRGEDSPRMNRDRGKRPQKESAMALTVVNHPLAGSMLTALRDEATPPPLFRLLTKRLSLVLAVEATRGIPTAARTVTTPLAEAQGIAFAAPLVAVPILRAGLGMLEAVTELFPEVAVGYLGLERDHATFQPSTYYSKLPDIEGSYVLLLDPMLATGGSAAAACASLFAAGPARVTLLSVVAAPEGLRRLEAEHPSLDVVTAAVDERLNDQAYIVPGLGDFGDRLFGT